MSENTIKFRAAVAEILPDVDSADNLNMSDVIGNKADTVAGTSIVSRALAAVTAAEAAVTAAIATRATIEGSFFGVARVYPTLANGITIAGGAGAWEEGLSAIVIPINTIHDTFSVFHLNIGSVSATDTYEVALFSDAGCTVEIGRTRTTKQTVQASASSLPISTPLLDAEAGIWAKVASKTGGGDILAISLSYRTYT